MKNYKIVNFCLLTCIMGIFVPGAMAASSTSASKVKAAIIFKITRFIHWNKDKVHNNKLNICVTGDNNLFNQLKTIEGKKTKGYLVAISKVKITSISHQYCNMLYIGNDEKTPTKDIVKNMRQDAIFLVSDRSSFAKQGGMVQIKERSGRIRFTVNLLSVRAAKLGISSQLLGLSKVIK